MAFAYTLKGGCTDKRIHSHSQPKAFLSKAYIFLLLVPN